MKLSKAQRSANAKKAWRKRKSSNPHKAVAKRRNNSNPRKRITRKTSRRRSGLGEIITDLQAKTGFNHMVNGAAGGLAAYALDSIFPSKMNNRNRLLWTAGVAFVVATVGRAPYMGAGIAAVATFKGLEEIGFLNENAYADPIEQLPMILDAEGNPMMAENETGGLYLDENGMYLDQNGQYLQDDQGNYLQEADYQVAYAPDFGGDWAHTWQQY